MQSKFILGISWSVLDDQWDSDHFPIVLCAIEKPCEATPQRCKLKKADWGLFSDHCRSEPATDKFSDCINPIELFISSLISIANQTIPKRRQKYTTKRKPWLTDACKQAINDRILALEQFKANHTLVNLENYKITRAKTRRIICQCKRDSWRTYISHLR
jgi:hypothetical protein